MRLPLYWIVIAALGGVGPLGMVTTPPVYAQAAGESGASRVAPARQQPLAQLLPRMSRAAGVTLLADSTVGGVSVAVPGEATTAANFEDQIAEIVRGLPAGTTWAKLYLPEPKGRRPYTGDDVAAYAVAQSKLFGPVGGTEAPGTVEIMGQKIPAERADAYVKGLNLQPYYVITNPNARGGQPGMMGSVDPRRWAEMSTEDRQRAVNQSASQLANLDPATRNLLMQQHFMVMSAMMRLLPPDQRGFETNIVGPNGERGVIRVIGKPDQR
jgi:hypothetical protein